MTEINKLAVAAVLASTGAKEVERSGDGGGDGGCPGELTCREKGYDGWGGKLLCRRSLLRHTGAPPPN